MGSRRLERMMLSLTDIVYFYYYLPPLDRINSIAYDHVLFKYPPIRSIAAEFVR
jgi:hypothetical protein